MVVEFAIGAWALTHVHEPMRSGVAETVAAAG
jgi:hypothetical protein